MSLLRGTFNAVWGVLLCAGLVSVGSAADSGRLLEASAMDPGERAQGSTVLLPVLFCAF